jgi:omega-amidase
MSILTLTTIQSDISWQNKAANLQMFANKIAAVPTQSQIIILPEMFSTGFSMQPKILAEKMDGATMQWLQHMSRTYKKIITGSFICEEDGKYFNRLIWMLPNGTYGVYDKRHLFAYAGEHEQYASGNKRLIASVNNFKINVQICYDLRFPVWARQQIQNEQPEYDILIYVANWPERRSYAWQQLLKARAIENQCYVIAVNRIGLDGNNINHNGDSMVIDALGEVLYHKNNVEDVHTFTLDMAHLIDVRTKFPFWKDGDNFTIE